MRFLNDTIERPHRRWLMALMTLCLALGLLPFGGCGVGTQSVLLPLHYENAPTSMTSSAGWQIDLTKATLSMGAIRCLEGKPAYTLLMPLPQLQQLLGARAAFAHPGHYLPEGTKAELLFGEPLDLLTRKEPFVGHLHGFTGYYGSVELEFGEKDRLHLEGTATKDGQSVAFAFDLAPGAYTVTGVGFQQEVTISAPTLKMSLSMERLFQWVDFGTFQQSGGKATPDNAAQNVLRKALHSNALYQIKADTTQNQSK